MKALQKWMRFLWLAFPTAMTNLLATIEILQLAPKNLFQGNLQTNLPRLYLRFCIYSSQRFLKAASICSGGRQEVRSSGPLRMASHPQLFIEDFDQGKDKWSSSCHEVSYTLSVFPFLMHHTIRYFSHVCSQKFRKGLKAFQAKSFHLLGRICCRH